MVDIVVEEVTNESVLSPPNEPSTQQIKYDPEQENTHVILQTHRIGAFITDNS